MRNIQRDYVEKWNLFSAGNLALEFLIQERKSIRANPGFIFSLDIYSLKKVEFLLEN